MAKKPPVINTERERPKNLIPIESWTKDYESITTDYRYIHSTVKRFHRMLKESNMRDELMELLSSVKEPIKKYLDEILKMIQPSNEILKKKKKIFKLFNTSDTVSQKLINIKKQMLIWTRDPEIKPIIDALKGIERAEKVAASGVDGDKVKVTSLTYNAEKKTFGNGTVTGINKALKRMKKIFVESLGMDIVKMFGITSADSLTENQILKMARTYIKDRVPNIEKAFMWIDTQNLLDQLHQVCGDIMDTVSNDATGSQIEALQQLIIVNDVIDLMMNSIYHAKIGYAYEASTAIDLLNKSKKIKSVDLNPSSDYKQDLTTDITFMYGKIKDSIGVSIKSTESFDYLFKNSGSKEELGIDFLKKKSALSNMPELKSLDRLMRIYQYFMINYSILEYKQDNDMAAMQYKVEKDEETGKKIPKKEVSRADEDIDNRLTLSILHELSKTVGLTFIATAVLGQIFKDINSAKTVKGTLPIILMTQNWICFTYDLFYNIEKLIDSDEVGVRLFNDKGRPYYGKHTTLVNAKRNAMKKNSSIRSYEALRGVNEVQKLIGEIFDRQNKIHISIDLAKTYDKTIFTKRS